MSIADEFNIAKLAEETDRVRDEINVVIKREWDVDNLASFMVCAMAAAEVQAGLFAAAKQHDVKLREMLQDFSTARQGGADFRFEQQMKEL